MGEITGDRAGLEIVAISGATIYIYQGTGSSSGPPIHTMATLAGQTATALAVGDVDADGNAVTDDDIVVGTGDNNIGEIAYYRNIGTDGTRWIEVSVDSIGEAILDLDLGDADKDILGR